MEAEEAGPQRRARACVEGRVAAIRTSRSYAHSRYCSALITMTVVAVPLPDVASSR
jgi:hypothetical protein